MQASEYQGQCGKMTPKIDVKSIRLIRGYSINFHGNNRRTIEGTTGLSQPIPTAFDQESISVYIQGHFSVLFQ